MKLSAQQKRRLGLASVFLGVFSSSLLARQYIDDLVVGKLVVCNDLGVGGTAVINQLNCCLTPQGQCAGGGEAEITPQTVSFSQLIFTPEDWTPPNCGGNVCDVLSVGTKIFNNVLYMCNGRVSSIGLIPLEPDNVAPDSYRIPSLDWTLPFDFITTGLVGLDPDFPLAVSFDVHVLVPGSNSPASGEVRLELFVNAVDDGDDLGIVGCPMVDCIAERVVEQPDDPCLLRHYVFRYCLPAADLYTIPTNQTVAQRAPWIRILVDRIDANEPYTGPVYLGLLSFTYPREFENVLYPAQGDLDFLCGIFNDDPSCQPPLAP